MPQEIYRLDEELSLFGNFREVGVKNSHEVAANLTYKLADGIVLDLLKHLPKANAPIVSFARRSVPKITGETRDEEHVLLLNSLKGSSSYSLATGKGHEAYRPHTLLISRRPILSLEATNFDLSFAGMELWLGKNFARLDPSNTNDAGTLANIRILAHEEQVDQVPHLSTRIETDARINHPDLGHTSFTVQHTALLVMISTEARNLEWFIEHSRRLRNLSCLCLGMYLPMRFCRLLNVVEEHYGKPVSYWSSVLYSQLQNTEWEEGSLPTLPVFDLVMLRTLQPDFMDLWFKLYDKAKDALDLFFAAQRGNTPYTDGRFLSYVQALETYSRLTTLSKPFNKKQFQQLCEKVKAGLPEEVSADMKERIIGGMRMSYEPSLRNRIAGSVARAAEVFGPDPLGLTSDICDRIVATRNYLTHYGKRSGKVFQLFEMTDAYIRIRVLISTLIFLDIGLPAHAIKARIENNPASFWYYNR